MMYRPPSACIHPRMDVISRHGYYAIMSDWQWQWEINWDTCSRNRVQSLTQYLLLSPLFNNFFTPRSLPSPKALRFFASLRRRKASIIRLFSRSKEVFIRRQFTKNTTAAMSVTNNVVLANVSDTFRNLILIAPTPDHRYHHLGEAIL